MSKRDVDDISGTETTGHEWDGIKELDTPMPRWWRGVFLGTSVWAIGYWVVYPAWPGISSYTHGILNHSQRDEVTANVAALKTARAAREHALSGASLSQIQSDPQLLQFAMAEGKAAFGDNCAACHGPQGKGNREFGAPNLTDNEWLYGPTREDIRDQIWNGHGGVMPTWGGRLSPETIKALAVYVHSLGGGE